MLSKNAKRLSRKKIYTGYAYDVVVDRVLWPNGRTYSRDLIVHGGITVIVPFLDEEHLVLLRQYRYGAQDILWEIPAGTIGRGEAPLACAKREIIEETGYRASRWKKITRFFASPGFSTEEIHAFEAHGLKAGKSALEEDEVLETRVVSLRQTALLIKQKKIRDAKSLVPLFYILSSRGLL
ncbi:MAG: NUDIX hydrolase [Candidatus Omnitrophica bacterium]|nr:NUDIX hydrolase [Candidatus Omnitrophota bacterium]